MFSGIKYILGYADESPNSLNHSGEEVEVANATETAAVDIAAVSVNVETDCKEDPMIEDDGQKNPPAEEITLEDCKEEDEQQQQANQQPNDNLSCDDGSIDMADVDETWEVIPPPCFTGSHITTSSEDEDDKQKPGKEANDQGEQAQIELPKSGGEASAYRENALIEHPSFYIASSSCKDVLVEKQEVVGDKVATDDKLPSCATAAANHEEKPMDWAKRIVLKKVAPKKKKVVRLDTVPQVLSSNAFEDAAWMSFNENVFAESDSKPELLRASPILEPVLEQPAPAVTEVVNKKPQEASGKLSYASVAAKIDESAFKVTPIKKKYTTSSASGSGSTSNKNKSSTALPMHSAEKKAKTSTPVWTNTKPLVEKKAWKNKFIVDDWDIDGQEDVDSDFDSMFEPVRKKKSSATKTNATKRQQQKQAQKKEKEQPQQQQQIEVQSVQNAPEVVDEDYLALDMSVSEPSSRSVSPCQADDTPASVIELCENNSDCSVELISMRSISMENSSIVEVTENTIPLMDSTKENDVQLDNKQAAAEVTRKRVVQVRPIEPERRPGWQLKRQRSKRRPLASSAQQNKQPNGGKSSPASKVSDSSNAKLENMATASQSSSSRSTPTFIDRIGNSIVANLTNLTNGLVSSGALNSNSPVGNQSPLIESNEKMQQTVVANKPSLIGVCTMNAGRKQLSKGFLDRQNICAQQSNRLRRPDRRLKMFTTPNGCSVNRKVHTSIH